MALRGNYVRGNERTALVHFIADGESKPSSVLGIFIQPTEPSSQGEEDGDLWLQTDGDV